MANVTFPGTFRSPGFGNTRNIQDGVGSLSNALVSAWSPGATLIDAVDLPLPSRTQTVSLISVSFKAYLAIWTAGMYGKLGRLLAGIVPSNPFSTNGGVTGVPWVSPILPLPPDPSLIVPLFDPASSPLPPQAQNFTMNPPDMDPALLSFVSATISPPQSVRLAEGKLGLGLWMERSLMGSVVAFNTMRIYVMGGAYSVEYDDGS